MITKKESKNNTPKKYQPPKPIKLEHQPFIKGVGLKLQEIRKEKGYTSSFVALNTGISRNMYYQMECGSVYFTISSLLRVLDFYQIPITEFLKDIKPE